MGFTDEEKYQLFLRQAPELERMLVDDGIKLFKYWFSVSREKQLERFEARQTDPLKHWKLSPIDLASQEKWDDYTAAKEKMFEFTHTTASPWTVVSSNHKKMAHLNCIGDFLSRLNYQDKNTSIAHPYNSSLLYQPPFHQFRRRSDD
jgi:polyphosphate kinase 2 (PPK2 family)